jgi:hypothetical protein
MLYIYIALELPSRCHSNKLVMPMRDLAQCRLLSLQKIDKLIQIMHDLAYEEFVELYVIIVYFSNDC